MNGQRPHQASEGGESGVAALPGLGLKPLLSLQRHWRVGVWAALLALVVGMPVVWVKGQSFYRSEGRFQVSPTCMRNLDVDKELELQSNSQYREFVNHLSNTVLRYDVIERALVALDRKDIRVQPEGWSRRRYIEALQRTVYVRPVADTYMVTVGKDDASPQHLDDLINALLDSFLETTKAEQIYGSGERLEVLEESRSKLEAEIAALMEQRVEKAEALGLTTFSENVQNPYDTMLFQAREKAALARIERSAAQATLDAFDEGGEVPTDFGRSLLEMRLQDNGLQALRNEVVKRSEELERLTAGLREAHPALVPAKQELAAIQAKLDERERAFDALAKNNFRERLVTTLALKSQVATDTNTILAELEAKAAGFARDFQAAMRLTSDINKREVELDRVRDRLGFLDTESNALGFVRIVTRALPADTPLGIGKTKLALALLVFAVAVGLSVPIAMDLLDPRIRSVNDAERIMGISSAGWQVEKEDLATRIFAADQARRFASSLLRSKARGGSNVFGFTAVKSGGGCTSTVLDVASAIRSLGPSVLVVEANAFAPDSRFLVDGPGLASLLQGECEHAEVVRQYRVDGTDIALVAMGVSLSSGLQRLDLLKSALDAWAQEYDYVLVDLPPLLQSADTELLIETLGQVYLIVAAESVVKGEVARARRTLQKVDPEAVGLFVNRLPVFRGSGYMESLVVETLTRTRYDEVMRWSRLRLEWEMLKTRVAIWLKHKTSKSSDPKS